MGKTVAVIGYGTAAVNAIIALRTSGYTDRVLVLSNTATLPYSPVLTSYYAGGAVPYENVFPWSAEELASLNVEVVENAQVTGLDVAAHTITTAQGAYEYDKCIIATGATPATKPVEGVKPALVLRTLDDAERLKEALTDPACDRVLVSGTSMVALKSVEACLDRGIEVTMLGRSEHILNRVALEETASAFEQALIEKGVDLRLSQVMEEIEPAGDNGELTRVTFSNGDVVDYSYVLIAHGVKPNLQFVAEGSLAMDKGLLVDDFMRTSDPDVYAAGDVAQTKSLISDVPQIAGLWKDACVQGACAGKAIAAELAGQEVPADAAYAGALPNNSITVSGAIMISGGTVALAPNRWADIQERNKCLVAAVYEQDVETGGVSLKGFNVFSNDADPNTSAAYDEGAMLYRRLIAQF